MTRACALSLAAGACVLAAASGAQAMDIRQMCASTARPDAIRSCSVIIADSLAPPEDRIIAMRNRGFSYQQQGDLDRAIGDQALQVRRRPPARPGRPHPRQDPGRPRRGLARERRSGQGARRFRRRRSRRPDPGLGPGKP